MVFNSTFRWQFAWSPDGHIVCDCPQGGHWGMEATQEPGLSVSGTSETTKEKREKQLK